MRSQLSKSDCLRLRPPCPFKFRCVSQDIRILSLSIETSIAVAAEQYTRFDLVDRGWQLSIAVSNCLASKSEPQQFRVLRVNT